MRNLFRKIESYLFSPVMVMPLVYFRVVFGGIMIWEVWRYIRYNRIERYYITPDFWFSYPFFDWVKPLPGDFLMYWVFYGLAIFAGMMALGLFYRLSATLHFITFTYIFLLDQTNYLNHFYLVSLVSFVMIFMPANRAYSLDNLLGIAPRQDHVPMWTLWWLRFQIAVPYIGGGIAKLNGDWLQAEPMRMWLHNRTHYHIFNINIGQLFYMEPVVYLFAYGGLVLDLFIVPLVLWRRTRWFALAGVLFFHLMNAWMFSIGIFPWFMIGATLLFLPPEWFGFWMNQGQSDAASTDESADGKPKPVFDPFPAVRYVTVLLAVWVAFQVLVPLRHFVYAGDVDWNEGGHNFSWHMKLRTKDAYGNFYAYNPRADEWEVIEPRMYLNSRQVDKMMNRPDLMLQFIHYAHPDLEAKANEPIEIYAWIMTSLNGRPHQLYLDPTVDLAREPRRLGTYDFVLKSMQPLKGEPRQTMLFAALDDQFLAMNMTEADFALSSLRLENSHAMIAEADWATESLGLMGCATLTTASYVVAPCDVRSAMLLESPAWIDEPLNIYFNGLMVDTCAESRCVMTFDPDAAELTVSR